LDDSRARGGHKDDKKNKKNRALTEAEKEENIIINLSETET